MLPKHEKHRSLVTSHRIPVAERIKILHYLIILYLLVFAYLSKSLSYMAAVSGISAGFSYLFNVPLLSAEMLQQQ